MELTTKRVALFSAVLVLWANVPCWSEDFQDYWEQGEWALRVEKWSKAVDLFTKSLENNPKFFMAYQSRAIAYSKLGEYDKSILDLREAVKLNPDYADAYVRLGLVYEIKGDFPEALKAYQEGMARVKSVTSKMKIQKFIQDVEGKIKKK
jgi:tetratricopeptide (TPR) repeat protein